MERENAGNRTIHARIEPYLKREAEAILHTLGLSVNDALTLFYKQVSLNHGLPFEVKIPNQKTMDAIRQARERDDLTEYSGLDELKQKFDS